MRLNEVIMIYFAISCVILATVGCKTFDDSRFRSDVLAYHQYKDSVLAGRAVDTASAIVSNTGLRPSSVEELSTLIDNGPVILAYRDTTMQRRTVRGEVASYRQDEAVVDLRNIRDEDLPYTLAVALRNVDGIYAQKDHPAYTRIDPGLSFLWALMLPAFAILGAAAGFLLGGLLNIGPNKGYFAVPDSAVAGFYLGGLGGIITWLALTF